MHTREGLSSKELNLCSCMKCPPQTQPALENDPVCSGAYRRSKEEPGCLLQHVRCTENEANFAQILRMGILGKIVQVSPLLLVPDPFDSIVGS